MSKLLKSLSIIVFAIIFIGCKIPNKNSSLYYRSHNNIYIFLEEPKKEEFPFYPFYGSILYKTHETKIPYIN